MRRIGGSWSQLHAAGFELSAVRSAGATYPELASAGYSVAELRKDGATVNELRSAEVSWPVLHEGGYSIKQLFDAGADHTVFTALGVSLRDVFAAGVPVSEYKTSDVDPADLLEAGWTWNDLVSARFAWSDLVVAGITWKAIEEAKLGLSDLRSLGASWSALKELGASGKQLKDAGATFEDLRLCGFKVDACKVLGASTSNLIEAGFAREELSDMDITVQDVIRATVSWPDLQGQGFTIAFLQGLGATWKDLKKIDVPWGELHEAGATWDELREAGATRRDLVALGAPFVLADFAPKTEMKCKPGQSVITATLVAGEPRIVVLEGSFVLVVNEGGDEVSRLRADEVFDSNVDDCSVAVDGGSDVAIASPKSIRVLDLKEGSVRFARQLSNKDGALVSVAISSHSQTVGLITRRSGLQTWNYASNKATGSYTGGSFDYTRDNLALSTSGKLAAFSSGNRIDVVSLENGEVVARCRDLPNPDITKIRIHGESQICWVHAGSGKSVYRSSFAAGGASDAVLVVRDESALSEATDLILDKDGEYAVLTPSGLVFGRFDTKQLQIESGSYMAGSLTYSRDQRYLLAYTSSKVSIWTPAGQ
ncbi:MAG: hypothetical protein KDB68_16760 [Planctomycetes bacterium]|nr:hypothetical protein [Planctomycetota bacterium]